MPKYWDNSNSTRFDNPEYTDEPPVFVKTTFGQGREKSKLRLAIEGIPAGKWMNTGIVVPSSPKPGQSVKDFQKDRGQCRASVSRMLQAIGKISGDKFITRVSAETNEIYVSKLVKLPAAETTEEVASVL